MALDTTYILGRGAVKDTYNLQGEGYQRYLGSSIKGEAREFLDTLLRSHAYPR